jgi:large subunit ribosomal protein L29
VNIADIRGKDSQELRNDLKDLRKQIFDARFRRASEEVAQNSQFRDARRTIARILTVLRQRELQQGKA